MTSFDDIIDLALITVNDYRLTKLFNQDLPKGYERPSAKSVEFNSEGVLCGSYNGAHIPEYADEDVWADD